MDSSIKCGHCGGHGWRLASVWSSRRPRCLAVRDGYLERIDGPRLRWIITECAACRGGGR